MTMKWSFMFFAVGVILSVIARRSVTQNSSSNPRLLLNFYHDSCPDAEKIIRSTVDELYRNQPSIGPALVRLLFHDCFINGCDASVLLNSTDGGQTHTEKDEAPNQTLKGFDIIEEIKSRLELVCPGVVSCSDILVVAAKEGVFLSGGPLYPILTGRRDGLKSFPEIALADIPAPTDDLSTILSKFAARNFSASETVSLLGIHSIGQVHCDFIRNRIFSTDGSNIDRDFLKTMRDRCADPESFIDMKRFGATEAGFGTHYFQGLIQNKSILESDQELMNEETTASWVRLYASDQYAFTKDFTSAIIKLSNLEVLLGQAGEIRLTCNSTLS